MSKLFRQFRLRDWAQVAICLLFIVVQVWLDLRLPDYMAEVTRLTQTPGSRMADIWIQGGYMLLSALGSFFAAVIVGFYAARIGAVLSKRLRSMLFEKVDSFSMEEMGRFSTASLITRSTNDVTQVQMLITMGLQTIIKAPILAAWAITKIVGKGMEWSAATGITLLILFGMIAISFFLIVPKFRIMQTLTDNLNRVTRENLTGLRVIRAYNAESYQSEKFEDANGALTQTQMFTSRAIAIMMSMLTLLMSGLTLAIYWIGAYLINGAGMMERITLFSNMVVFSSYAMQVIMAFIMMFMIFLMLPRALVSARRIREVLETQPVIKNGTAKEGLPGRAGEVEFRNVSFKYPGAADYVIQDISFTARQGETVAFIGSTGSGKSTLINLIPRFYDATEGEVLVGGVNVCDYDLSALHSKIGYVPQKAVLFRGTVESNVAFGDNGREKATEEDVARAVRVAQGTDFVEAMEGGYAANIAQAGANISGGQKQRLSIARAVCFRPEIYIFDDSFSALDYRTDRALRTALKRETAGVTSLIVAQRIGTIMDADRIVVLDEGRVAGIGTHKELLKTCAVYKEIAMSQLSEEELAS